MNCSLKKISRILLIFIFSVSFSTSCQNINEETTFLELVTDFQELVEGVSEEFDAEIEEGIDVYKAHHTLSSVSNDGSITFDATIFRKPFKLANREMEGTIVFSNYQSQEGSSVVNGVVNFNLRAIRRPFLATLLLALPCPLLVPAALVSPIITYVEMQGVLELTGNVNETLDIDLVMDVEQEPDYYKLVINGVDYSETVIEFINKNFGKSEPASEE